MYTRQFMLSLMHHLAMFLVFFIWTLISHGCTQMDTIGFSGQGILDLKIEVFQLTFEDISTFELFNIRSLAQSPAEKHQNHVLNHCACKFQFPSLSKPAALSSLRAFSRGTPYVSISHPNPGCGDALTEALPTSGIVKRSAAPALV